MVATLNQRRNIKSLKDLVIASADDARAAETNHCLGGAMMSDQIAALFSGLDTED